MINYLDLLQPYEGHACQDTPKDVFFPLRDRGDQRPYRQAVEKAQAICRACPLQMRCYRDAKARRETFGIWGGVNFSFRQRRGVREYHADETDSSAAR